MEDFKFLVPILREMLKKNPSLAGAIMGSKEQVRKVIRREAFFISLRVLVGLVVSSAIIYSIIRLLQEAHFLLITTTIGPWYTILFFTSIVIVGVIALTVLFKRESEPAPEAQSRLEVLLEKVAYSFFEGLLEGMNKAAKAAHKAPHKKSPLKSKQSDETDADEDDDELVDAQSDDQFSDRWDVSNGYRKSYI